jgi:polar amino acid transport system substrate-binding protein
MRARTTRWTCGAVALVLGAAGCNLPRDGAGTLDRVHGGTVRVGVMNDAPWAFDSSGTTGGVEGALASEIARRASARIAWVRGTEGDLLPMLERREVDLVIGGLTADLPWARQVAFTRPYYTDTVIVGLPDHRAPQPRAHVLAVAPGENAWLMHVERVLLDRKDDIPTMVRSAHP